MSEWVSQSVSDKHSQTVTTSFELPSSHARVTSIKFTKRYGVSWSVSYWKALPMIGLGSDKNNAYKHHRYYRHICYICYIYPERHVFAQVILAFSVFMLAIAERMPETSESIPLIGENWISIWMLVFGINHNRFVNWELLALDAQNLALAPFSWFTVGELQYMAKYFSD